MVQLTYRRQYLLTLPPDCICIKRQTKTSTTTTTIQGYRIGAETDERINNLIQGTQRYLEVIICRTQYSSNEVTGKKSIVCGRSVGAGNSIVNNTLTLKDTTSSMVSLSESWVTTLGYLMVLGLIRSTNITDGVNSDQIKIPSTLNDVLLVQTTSSIILVVT